MFIKEKANKTGFDFVCLWWTSAELNRGLTAVRKAFYTFSRRLITDAAFPPTNLTRRTFKILPFMPKIKQKRRYPTQNDIPAKNVGILSRNGA